MREIRLITSTAESINQEAEYIIRKAQAHEVRIVVIGVLLFFFNRRLYNTNRKCDIQEEIATMFAPEKNEPPDQASARKKQ